MGCFQGGLAAVAAYGVDQVDQVEAKHGERLPKEEPPVDDGGKDEKDRSEVEQQVAAEICTNKHLGVLVYVGVGDDHSAYRVCWGKEHDKAEHHVGDEKPATEGFAERCRCTVVIAVLQG